MPNREAREYRLWITERIRARQSIYTEALEPGLLSVLTPVWNGSPLKISQETRESVSSQNQDGACEWVILDNGCTNASLLSYLADLKKYSWVKVYRVETNIGITAGLRYCLEHATWPLCSARGCG